MLKESSSNTLETLYDDDVDQLEPAVFNKASLMNAGFKQTRSMAHFDCYIFHDVDMLPEDDRNFYTCSNRPRHIGSNIDKWGYT